MVELAPLGKRCFWSFIAVLELIAAIVGKVAHLLQLLRLAFEHQLPILSRLFHTAVLAAFGSKSLVEMALVVLLSLFVLYTLHDM